jgi:septal ring factor EnvC (AmiA/AmiB activator)
MKRLPVVLLALSCCWLSYTSADQASTEAQLKKLSREMRTVRNQIDTYKGEQKSLKLKLRKAEEKIGKGKRSLREVQKQLNAKNAEIVELEKRQETLVKAKNQQQDAVAAAIREAYERGNQNRFKLILNQEDPAAVARLLNYYDYYNRARKTEIEQYLATLEELNGLLPQLADARDQLQLSLKAKRNQQAELQKNLKQRRSVLLQLDHKLKNSNSKFQSLQREHEKLEKLVREVETRVASLKAPPSSSAFAKRKGKMSWPIDAGIKYRFGARKPDSQIRWQGMMFNARGGQEVRAIHGGHVVFAEWFASRGLLLIIDHGDDYMSL